MLKAKKILVCISGGIAAYKSLSLIRLLIKGGAEVRVVATQNALKFVTPLSIETLSKNKLYSETFSPTNTYQTEHIAYSDWADCMIVAPATANIIGKFAHGIADDALSTLYLAFTKEVFIAPAMNTAMYQHIAIRENCLLLQKRGTIFIEATAGELACGVEGEGRMEEPEKIVHFVQNYFANRKNTQNFVNKQVLITAGPTYEGIDPVRFIGNRSSGLMGYAIAEAFAEQGAQVILVSGPSQCKTLHPNIQRIDVESAAQMYEQCQNYWASSQIGIMTAAVADYTPANPSVHKIKKTTQDLVIELKPTQDILKSLGNSKKEGQFLVGFALETQNELENAKKKLVNKNADLIVLNSLQDAGAGFATSTNKVSFLSKEGQIITLPLKSKSDVALDLLAFISQKI